MLQDLQNTLQSLHIDYYDYLLTPFYKVTGLKEVQMKIIGFSRSDYRTV